MSLPDWRHGSLRPGALREPVTEFGRLVLWLPSPGGQPGQRWERVATAPRAEVRLIAGLSALPATSVLAHQPPRRGVLSRLFARSAPSDARQSWTLPNGESAQQSGERQEGLFVVWGASGTAEPNEAQIRACWPQATRVEPLGVNLFLVLGVHDAPSDTVPVQIEPQATPREGAEQLLAAARAAGDRRQELTALTDLGAAQRGEGHAQVAIGVLEEALVLARQRGDSSAEADVLGELGLAVLATREPDRARPLFEQELALRRAGGARHAEKVALERLGIAWSDLKQPVRALACFAEGLTISRSLGDRKHEADLLWQVAVEQAELGQRDEALNHARAAVELLQKLGKPQAGWFADHLRKYEMGEPNAGLGGRSDSGPATAAPVSAGSVLVAGGWGLTAPASPPAAPPRWLRLAVTATQAMAKFIGSGLQTVSTETYEARLRVCAGCAQHTGLRCRLCGCFTRVKAHFPHEDCPAGKWPDRR